MRKHILTFVGLLAFALPAWADMSSDFKDNFRLNGLAAYNRDIATMVGLADFHTGQSATFPGFDVGGVVAGVKTSSDNFSKKNYFYAPFVVAETQLPILGLGVALRGTAYDDFESLGGGLKWNGSLALVHFSTGIFYDHYKTDYYNGNHYSASASASVSVLMFTPYIGIGYDYSEMKVKSLGDFSGKKSDDGVMRYTAGVNFHPLPLLYVYGAYTYTKYNQGFQGGVGINL